MARGFIIPNKASDEDNGLVNIVSEADCELDMIQDSEDQALKIHDSANRYREIYNRGSLNLGSV